MEGRRARPSLVPLWGEMAGRTGEVVTPASTEHTGSGQGDLHPNPLGKPPASRKQGSGCAWADKAFGLRGGVFGLGVAGKLFEGGGRIARGCQRNGRDKGLEGIGSTVWIRYRGL